MYYIVFTLRLFGSVWYSSSLSSHYAILLANPTHLKKWTYIIISIVLNISVSILGIDKLFVWLLLLYWRCFAARRVIMIRKVLRVDGSCNCAWILSSC